MLKRLELVGFKSFADKTQFDFPAGITAVVGPNGSGKSNVVDAVRWVLGEQSAKSLRGGEMADVIFNGSSSRRSLGMAEVTMTFDNTRRVLATEADEVHITRRVYRDGEGEYLINHQPSRLRDIKELFLGSGAGTDAYCIIEQGRVDVLLQASTRDRRTIFEEAAGISRFKAKKIETQRKLERVDQNLERLRDIVEEVQKQLRSVKLQAAKAERYQEYSTRLRELRVALGLQEFHQLAEQLQKETGVLDGLRTRLDEQARQAEAWEADTRRLEETLGQLEETTRAHEAGLARARQEIAAEETTLGHESTLSADLETELARSRTHAAELQARVATLAAEAARAGAAVGGVEAECAARRQDLSTLEAELRATQERLTELHSEVERDKAGHLDQMRQAARLQNDVVSYKSQLDSLHRARERLLQRTEQAAEHLASLDVELQELTQADEALQARLTGGRQTLAERRQERDRLRELCDATTEMASTLRAERSGLASRIEVLEGLERTHEGLGTGVREVCALLEQPQPGPWRAVLGMVANLLTVRREYAPLIDLALGERAQRFLVRDRALLEEALRQVGQPFSGRVSFVPLVSGHRPDELGETRHSADPAPLARGPLPPWTERLPAHPGLVAPAQQLVTCDLTELADLPAQLLGRTLIVRDLATAHAIASQTSGYRFVTLQGELLEADGTLTVGTHHAEAGILSRKSELRELRVQVAALDRRIAETERDLTDLRERGVSLDTQTEALQEELDVLAEQAADLRTRLGQHRQRRQGLHEEVTLSRQEISGVEQDIAGLDTSWRQAQAQAQAAEQEVLRLQSRLAAAEQEIRTRDRERQTRQQECTAAQVALAQIEERLAALRAKHRQTEADLHERQREQAEGAARLAGARSRLTESQRTMLDASAALARWYLEKESAEGRLAELIRQRDHQRRERHQLNEQAQAARSAWRAEQEQAHACELQVNDLRHRRDTLVDRLREDYQLDLAELYRQAQEAPPPESAEKPAAQESALGEPVTLLASVLASDAAAINEEVAELKRKLGRLGSVNLDSLQELAELEERARTLQGQLDDLNRAKAALEEIIGKINQDSRRLFTESFQTIRGHFQELFRKLFGGGMAEIVLEDESDILESGIEIVARPPGKELSTISLMSGGEKTLTAVALLLAIFRSKPSPFCILDEVDAALDEANIGRFTAVLRDFLDRSHFIVVTHSKRTMAIADVLYGITMQESGISKRVAMRFKDWEQDGAPTNGHNGQGAVREATASAPPELS
jgi:chromosome segregation protein